MIVFPWWKYSLSQHAPIFKHIIKYSVYIYIYIFFFCAIQKLFCDVMEWYLSIISWGLECSCTTCWQDSWLWWEHSRGVWLTYQVSSDRCVMFFCSTSCHNKVPNTNHPVLLVCIRFILCVICHRSINQWCGFFSFLLCKCRLVLFVYELWPISGV